ncbi:PspC domain-containing protein [Bacteroidia bacterium]|nr:PspC domain-containing protein [Bacteroidia bacterium]MDB9881941.1 PspC domain-containing protein [Bacteroidia bacterium]
MNKIIQINLSGQAVSIDEKAYEILSKYLGSLENCFSNTESGNEILADIEARITELFFTKMKNGNSFINDGDVNEAIELMGKPEDLGIEEEFEQSTTSHASYSARNKKLFRDPNDKVLSGVCSGLGAYFGMEASVVRIIFLLLIFVAGVPLLAYLILWIAIPEAKTPQDRYRMHGDANTVSDIANNIRNEANSVASNLRDGANRISDDLKKNPNLDSTIKGLANGVERVIRFFSKIFGAGLLSLLVMFGIGLSVALLSNATGGLDINWNGSQVVTPSLLKSPTFNWIFSISLLSLLLIPICTLCYAILQFIFNMTAVINFKGVFIAWLLSLAVFIGIALYAAGNFNIEAFQEFGEQIERMSQRQINRV